MSTSWQKFWNTYLAGNPITEADLFRQVGHTVNKVPISPEDFKAICVRNVELLQLSPTDFLLDFCCGNGLFSYELAPHVRSLIGVDFCPNIIHAAHQYKARNNIKYVLGDARDPLATLLSLGEFPNKFLINYSLAYFQPAQLSTILVNIIEYLEGRPFVFLASGIPNFDAKRIFYNTAERFEQHLQQEKLMPDTNGGLGRWWRPGEIGKICWELGLDLVIENQSPYVSGFRMTALISSTLTKWQNPDENPTRIPQDIAYHQALKDPSVSTLLLRKLSIHDIERCHRWHNDPELYSTLVGEMNGSDLESERCWVDERVRFASTESSLAICLSPSGKHIGNLYLKNIDWITGSAEFHIFIGDPEDRGKGYGTVATRKLLHGAFHAMKLNRITLEVLADNHAAIKAYEKCGFVTENHNKHKVMKSGQVRDTLLMSVESDKYKQLAKGWNV